jgi:ATP/maltotriose-dependent transcriptional regulator MalT
MLLPVAERHQGQRDYEAAYEVASHATSIGNRFGDADLVACAIHVQGRSLLQQGKAQAGLALLDEAMVAVTSGELSPLVTGLIYCSVIEACQEAYALGRAREWTSALASWCDRQPEMVAFTTTCLLRRAEILQLNGAWPEAVQEVQRACDRFSAGTARKPPGAAFYQQAEVHRLRGEFKEAEQAYQDASQGGWDPQPGLALLRMAQGRIQAASAAIRRVVVATADRLQRTRLLPAYIEILLEAGELEEARGACAELEQIAESFESDVLTAMAAQGRGDVELAAGDAQTALRSLRDAWNVWQRVEVPYAAARVRVLMGLACRVLGDEEGSRLEFNGARAVFRELGALPDIERIDLLLQGKSPTHAHRLTSRELQVLRLIASGKTNKAIAADLSLSERTIHRHVSNIFCKLDVATRAAATAYAYEHDLV